MKTLPKSLHCLLMLLILSVKWELKCSFLHVYDDNAMSPLNPIRSFHNRKEFFSLLSSADWEKRVFCKSSLKSTMLTLKKHTKELFPVCISKRHVTVQWSSGSSPLELQNPAADTSGIPNKRVTF